MPKNKINGFWLFVQRVVRPEMSRRYGVNFSPAMLNEEADRQWKALPKPTQKSWNSSAKNMRANGEDDLEHKMDHTGVSFAEKMRQEEASRMQTAAKEHTVKSLVERASYEDNLLDKTFNLVHFNIFCKTEDQVYIPAEVAIVSFNIKDGIKSEVCKIIHPLALPTGYQLEAVTHSKATHNIPTNNFNSVCQNYAETVSLIEQEASTGGGILFTIPSEIETSTHCLQWLYDQFNGHNCFEIYDLNLLLSQIVRQKTCSLPEVAISSKLMESTFDYTKNIGCNWHERLYAQNEDVEIKYCSLHTAKRWVYLLSALVAPLFDVTMMPVYHFPRSEMGNYSVARSAIISAAPVRRAETTSISSSCSVKNELQQEDVKPLRRPMSYSSVGSIKLEPTLDSVDFGCDIPERNDDSGTENSQGFVAWNNTNSKASESADFERVKNEPDDYDEEFPSIGGMYGGYGPGIGRGRGFAGKNF